MDLLAQDLSHLAAAGKQIQNELGGQSPSSIGGHNPQAPSFSVTAEGDEKEEELAGWAAKVLGGMRRTDTDCITAAQWQQVHIKLIGHNSSLLVQGSKALLRSIVQLVNKSQENIGGKKSQKGCRGKSVQAPMKTQTESRSRNEAKDEEKKRHREVAENKDRVSCSLCHPLVDLFLLQGLLKWLGKWFAALPTPRTIC